MKGSSCQCSKPSFSSTCILPSPLGIVMPYTVGVIGVSARFLSLTIPMICSNDIFDSMVKERGFRDEYTERSVFVAIRSLFYFVKCLNIITCGGIFN